MEPLQKPVAEVIDDLRRRQARQAIFVDLNLIADKQYAAQLFEALVPLSIQWYGLATTLLCDDPPLLELAARSGCRGLLMGLESMSPGSLRHSHKGFNDPARYAEVRHCYSIPRHGTSSPFGTTRPDPDQKLGTVRRPTCGLSTCENERGPVG